VLSARYSTVVYGSHQIQKDVIDVGGLRQVVVDEVHSAEYF